MGGVYALARLAEVSEAHRRASAEVLNAFIRERCPWPPKPTRPDETAALEAETGRSLRQYDPDVQVAITLLGQQTSQWHHIDRLRFPNLDLRKVTLKDGHFEDAVFTESHLTGAWMRRAKLSGASFRGATLINANLEGAVLVKCNMRGAALDECIINATDFTDAQLDGATMMNAKFDEDTKWPVGFTQDDAISKGAVLIPKT